MCCFVSNLVHGEPEVWKVQGEIKTTQGTGAQITNVGRAHLVFHTLLFCRMQVKFAHATRWAHAVVVLCAVCASNSPHLGHWNPDVVRSQVIPNLHRVQRCPKHQGRQGSHGLLPDVVVWAADEVHSCQALGACSNCVV